MTLNEGLVVTSVSGFDDHIYVSTPTSSQFGYGGATQGWYKHLLDRKTRGYTLLVSNLGNIVADCVNESSIRESKVTVVDVDAIAVKIESDVAVEPTHANPTPLARRELIRARCDMDYDFWALSRSSFVNAITVVPGGPVVDCDFWPNSGGLGSETITPWTASPPKLHHILGNDWLSNGPRFFEVNAFNAPAWSQMPW